jgi:hypothetical protein
MIESGAYGAAGEGRQKMAVETRSSMGNSHQLTQYAGPD